MLLIFQPALIKYGDRKVVIMVIDTTIGRIKALVAPTSAPPFAVTSASSPPDAESPKPALIEVFLLMPCILAAMYTVPNFAPNDVAIRMSAGIMNIGSSLTSMSAPTDTKNSAANMSFSGVVIILAIDWVFDSATRTPAKNAPAATDMPMENAMNDRPNATPSTVMRIRSYWFVLPI